MKSPTAFSKVSRFLPGCGGSLWERTTDPELAVAVAVAVAVAAGTQDRAGQEAIIEIVRRRHRAAVCAVAWVSPDGQD